MSGLNNTGTESLCLVPASVWGAGTAIPSAVCEGKHDFNAKSLHHLSMVCSSTLFYIFAQLQCGHLADICDSRWLPTFLVFSHSRVPSQADLAEGSSSSLLPHRNPSFSSSFPLSPGSVHEALSLPELMHSGQLMFRSAEPSLPL